MATPKGTFAELVANLADPSGEVRRRAVQKIMRRSRERQQAFEQFVQLLNDPDYQVYKVVIKALGELGDARALPVLACELKQGAYRKRILALKALAKQGSAQTFAIMLPALEDEVAGVRIAALQALAEIDGDKSVSHLLTALDDQAEKVRLTALLLLGSLGRQRALSSQGKPQVILRVAGTLQDASYGVRVSGVKALVWLCEEQAVPYLQAASENQAPEVRLQALTELVRLAEPRVGIAQLLRALGDSYEPVRRFAIDVLKAMARTNAQVVPALLRLTDHAHVSVREGVFQILSEREDRQSILALRKALQDESAQVRLLAVNTLKKVDDRQVVMPLLPLLKDVDVSVRRRSADALGAFKDARAIEPLLDVLQSDGEAEVRRHAFWALGRITNQDRAFQDIWRALSGAERALRTREVLDMVIALVADWRSRARQ